MADPFSYAGKSVVVTGCNSGIGATTTRLLLEAGALVYAIDVRRLDPRPPTFIEADLRDRSSIDSALTQIVGPIDAVFNCAGLPPMSPSLEVMKVNFIGMRHFAEGLLAQMPEGGAIVSVGSNGGAGWRAHLGELAELAKTDSFEEAVRWCEASERTQRNAYNVSKEAVVVWTLVWSQHTITRGVRLNCTSPGAVQTPMLVAIEQAVPPGAIEAVTRPSGRRSSPLEQAQVLLMLNSPLASYVNGVDLPVDGGFIAAKTAPV